MGTPLTPLQRLGQRAARTQDRALTAARVAEATKARLLALNRRQLEARSFLGPAWAGLI